MKQPFTLFSFRKRILALLLVISFIFCALGVRLFVIQIINGKSLQLKAIDQWTRDLKIVAPRGTIYDRTGATLAVSYTTYNVFVRAREVKSPTTVATALSTLLNIDFDNVYQKVQKKNVSEVLIKLGVESEIAEKIYQKKLSGVYLAENVSRYYPNGNLASQLIGFTSVDNVGQTGVEAYYDELLKGQDGYSYVQSDLQGKEIGGSLRYYIQAQEGEDLYLSIDSKMQQILENALNNIMQEQKAKNASGMIIDVTNGDILAMSTKPSFDLNELPRDDLDILFDQSKMKLVTDMYEPGSTFKILTVAAALEEGLTSLEDKFYCPGYRIVDGIKIKCWKTIGHGSQTLLEAFGNSCNCCFMDLALRLGVEKFYQYMEKFGIGQKTGIDISGESSGMLMPKSSVKTVDLARMGFGHAIAMTPIQLMNAVCSIIGGQKIDLSILYDENKQDSQNVSVISSNTTKLVNQLLEYAENKTGKYTFVEGYNVGGKTGTAQKYKETGGIDQGKYISSFIGTYPADAPKYAIIVLVDEPSAGVYYGSLVAAPYGKQIFENLFIYLNEEKQDDSVVVEKVAMPNLIGMSLGDALIELRKIGLYCEIEGDGGIITKQLPPAGTSINKGTTILLVT